MPAKITKKDNKYQVSTPNGVHAKGTTKEKAKAQVRLLNAIDHGWKPTHHSAANGEFIDSRMKRLGVVK
jgi:hypothetical protein